MEQVRGQEVSAMFWIVTLTPFGTVAAALSQLPSNRLGSNPSPCLPQPCLSGPGHSSLCVYHPCWPILPQMNCSSSETILRCPSQGPHSSRSPPHLCNFARSFSVLRMTVWQVCICFLRATFGISLRVEVAKPALSLTPCSGTADHLFLSSMVLSLGTVDVGSWTTLFSWGCLVHCP